MRAFNTRGVPPMRLTYRRSGSRRGRLCFGRLGLASDMAQFLTVIDTPGIKPFVFGTDALAEIRGASALLDRLNRVETSERLKEALSRGVKKVFANGGAGQFVKVFANGGAGQFVVEARDRSEVRAALDHLAAYYRKQTGGEMRPLAGVAEWNGNDGESYRAAVEAALEELHLQRSLAAGNPSVPTLPFVLECESTSHLPAVGAYRWGNEQLILSEASRLKREESRTARGGILWSGWMESLDSEGRFVDNADKLRYADAEGIGQHSCRNGYVALVYADGNSMGRILQELDSRDVYKAFSELVDGSVRDACYEALSTVCAPEVEQARDALTHGENPGRLPADILLLGGDDLLVMLPADRALNYALQVTKTFERLTKDRQKKLSVAAQSFFKVRQLDDRGVTISCGVAIGPARYPFYLLLDLAEDLLRSAKRGGSADSTKTDYWSPTYVDFHLVAGSVGQDLSAIRELEYFVQSNTPRTLRPYRRDRLEHLRDAAQQLRQARLPRGKLHDLFEAALERRRPQAERRAQELFGQLRQDNAHDERGGLWKALSKVGPLNPFPWTDHNARKATALADVVEAHDLFGRAEER
jgi:hypothetical protein